MTTTAWKGAAGSFHASQGIEPRRQDQDAASAKAELSSVRVSGQEAEREPRVRGLGSGSCPATEQSGCRPMTTVDVASGPLRQFTIRACACVRVCVRACVLLTGQRRRRLPPTVPPRPDN
jgi:hypothetical protein